MYVCYSRFSYIKDFIIRHVHSFALATKMSGRVLRKFNDCPTVPRFKLLARVYSSLILVPYF